MQQAAASNLPSVRWASDKQENSANGNIAGHAERI